MAWWGAMANGASTGSALDDNSEDPIDLTSDTEISPLPGGGASAAAASSPSNGGRCVGIESTSGGLKLMAAKKEVKSEGVKRAAEASAKAQQSGEVLVTNKPPAEKIHQEEEEEGAGRPAKRSKGGDEEDMEVVGTTGTAKLPHNRFACTEHKFEGPQGSSGHKEKCSLCFCYVCDLPASECLAWGDHCHATDTGPMKSSWKLLRERAKAYLRAGKPPPLIASVSSMAPMPYSAGNVGGGGGGGSSSSGNVNVFVSPTVSNDCNCEELCKHVHAVFLEMRGHSVSQAKVPVVYLTGLTQQQVQHVEDISIQSTLDREVQKRFQRRYPGATGSALAPSARHNILVRFASGLKPNLLTVVLPNGKRDVTVACNDREASYAAARLPFKELWTPGAAHGAIRFGRVSNIPFKLDSTQPSPEKRKEYFDRFVSKTPMPRSLWYPTTRVPSYFDRYESGAVDISKEEDQAFLEYVKRCYEVDLVDVETEAVFDPVANSGSFSMEVILLRKLITRGTSLAARSPDLTPLVERCILNRVHKRPTLAEMKSRHLSSLTSAVAAAGVSGAGAGASSVLGREFTPSTKDFGGYASVDVSLSGLINSVRDEETNSYIEGGQIHHPAKMLLELENLQHRSLAKQPDCLTVELYEHQKQDAQWMMDQEMLEGGSMQHLWAELPAHHLAPADGQRTNEFRRCWFSPVLNQFTAINPFASTMKGGILCDEMGLGKTAATLCLHLIHPPKTPAPGVPLDEKEWGPILGKQASPLTDCKSVTGATEEPGKWVSKGTLVVCKVSLVGQWVEEAKRLCGGALSIYPYHGGNRRKDPAFLAKFDIVVTTYGVVQYDASRNSGFPPLRRIRWWRVVLDESHTIATAKHATNEVRDIVSNRRWCMTGTPYISRFSDANGQLSFVGAGGAFKGIDLGDKGPNRETQAETVAFLRRVLLRHSQGMKLGGKSILGLPSITHKVEVLALSTKERKAYVDFEKGLQNDYIKVRHRLRTQKGSHTMEVLTLLSKFRQACSGGQLLVGDSATVGGDGDGSTPASVDAFCPICNDIIESPVRTKCGHTFCQACISSVLTKKEDDQGPCPKCKKTVRLDDLTHVGGGAASAAAAAAAAAAPTGSSSGAAKPEPQGQGSGGGSAGGGGSSSSGGSCSSSSSPGTGVVMETKLKALVEMLAGIHAKDPTSKSLVFSQFNSSLEWLKRTLPKRGFQFRTLTGSMSRTQRTAALTAFAKDPPTTVFLLSVRSGAVGINLTQANNVFLLEPLLNLALEKQAVGRVYRLGQTRPVTVTKLVLKDSIETRILALQKKQATEGSASAAVGAGSNGIAGNIARDNAKNLKIDEYNSLFGVKADNSAVLAELERRNARKYNKKAAKRKRSLYNAMSHDFDSFDEYDDYDGGLPGCAQS